MIYYSLHPYCQHTNIRVHTNVFNRRRTHFNASHCHLSCRCNNGAVSIGGFIACLSLPLATPAAFTNVILQCNMSKQRLENRILFYDKRQKKATSRQLKGDVCLMASDQPTRATVATNCNGHAIYCNLQSCYRQSVGAAGSDY